MNQAILSEQKLNQLATNFFVEVQNLFPNELCFALKDMAISAYESDEMKRAGIGRDGQGYGLRLDNKIRTDEHIWLASFEETQAVLDLKKILNELLLQINQEFYLGIDHFETQFAHYAKGAFYKKHYDSHRENPYRVLTLVTYFNQDWSEGDGGQLVVYDSEKPSKELCRFLPEQGRSLIFFSEKIPHEVLAANKERYSMATWFRRPSPLMIL